jgi:hypothetical protein
MLSVTRKAHKKKLGRTGCVALSSNLTKAERRNRTDEQRFYGLKNEPHRVAEQQTQLAQVRAVELEQATKAAEMERARAETERERAEEEHPRDTTA